MNNIVCPHCGKTVEITKALAHQFEDKIRQEVEAERDEDIKKITQEIEAKTKRKVKEELDFNLKNSANELEETKQKNIKLQEQLLELNKTIRDLSDKFERKEIEDQKKLNEEREKIKEAALKNASAKAELEKAELTKQLEDTKKALEDAQRKVSQKSQQLQGEVLELELEQMLKTTFPYDEIEPIAKGVNGADLRQIVKSQRGTFCGVILWELKRTKEWSDKWVDKLKEDLRLEKANIPVIVSITMPKGLENGFGIKDDVWVCNQALVLPLAILLRKNLLDVGYQKAISANKGDKADLLYSYITSHEFQQQIANIVEAYQEMHAQISKERILFEKSWKQREAQAQRVVDSAANVYGNIQGRVGASMPQVKELEFTDIALPEVTLKKNS